LLNISRIDLGTFAVEPEPCDFCAIAKSVMAELQPMIAAKKMAVKTDCDDDLPPINADIKLVRIIFQNLLTNALKYTPEKGKVTVSIAKQGRDILIKVADNGYGIPEEAKSKIFTKLFRADNIREVEAEGTGLGLYIVKSIVEQAGGRVWFDSLESKGTTFYVTLPLSGMVKKTGSRALS
jgi:signal transduction histidine kinase